MTKAAGKRRPEAIRWSNLRASDCSGHVVAPAQRAALAGMLLWREDVVDVGETSLQLTVEHRPLAGRWTAGLASVGITANNASLKSSPIRLVAFDSCSDSSRMRSGMRAVNWSADGCVFMFV